MSLRRAAAAAVLTIAVAACGSTLPVTPMAGGPAQLQVYAAASLKTVLTQAKAAYQVANPGITITLSTDSSAALETKIEQGAPADLFLSADTANPQRLVDKSLAAGQLVKLASNQLTVIVPAGNPAGIASPADLARPGVKVIAAAASVPIAKYATELVANLGALPGYPAGFANAYGANIVSREDNVGAVTAKIALGEGDAAIVYATDAKTANKVETVPVPDAANVRATYGAVALARSSFAVASANFLAWLTGPDGQAIFAAFGFLPAR